MSLGRLHDLKVKNQRLETELVEVDKEIKKVRQKINAKLSEQGSKEIRLQIIRDAIMEISEAVVLVSDVLQNSETGSMLCLLASNTLEKLPSLVLCELVLKMTPLSSVEFRLAEKFVRAHGMLETIGGVDKMMVKEQVSSDRLLSSLLRSLSPTRLRWISEVSYAEVSCGTSMIERLQTSLQKSEEHCCWVIEESSSFMEKMATLDSEIANLEVDINDSAHNINVRWSDKMQSLIDAFTHSQKLLKDERSRLSRLSSENKHLLLRMGIKPSQMIRHAADDMEQGPELGLSNTGVAIWVPPGVVTNTPVDSGDSSIEERILYHKLCVSHFKTTHTKERKVHVREHGEVFAQDSLKAVFQRVSELHELIVECSKDQALRISEADALFGTLSQLREENEESRCLKRNELLQHQSFRAKLNEENQEWKAVRRQLLEFVKYGR